jgi:hypothetical protein
MPLSMNADIVLEVELVFKKIMARTVREVRIENSTINFLFSLCFELILRF